MIPTSTSRPWRWRRASSATRRRSGSGLPPSPPPAGSGPRSVWPGSKYDTAPAWWRSSSVPTSVPASSTTAAFCFQRTRRATTPIAACASARISGSRSRLSCTKRLNWTEGRDLRFDRCLISVVISAGVSSFTKRATGGASSSVGSATEPDCSARQRFTCVEPLTRMSMRGDIPGTTDLTASGGSPRINAIVLRSVSACQAPSASVSSPRPATPSFR